MMKKPTKGQIIIVVLKTIGRLPLWASRLLGRWIGLLLWIFPNRSKDTTRRNIAQCFPELSSSEQRRRVFHSLQHTGMVTCEIAAIWCHSQEWLQQHIVGVKNQSLLDQALADNKGLILLLPHIGNWEVFGRYIPALTSMVALYEPPRWQELETFIRQQRELAGAQLVPTNQRGVAALLKHLRGGGTTCILPDQVPNKRDGGVFVPFFNQPAHTMTLVTQLAQRTHCCVLGATAERVRSGFEIAFYSIDESIYSDDEETSVIAINQFVEHCARKMPEQYQWEYKRFRRKPRSREAVTHTN